MMIRFILITSLILPANMLADEIYKNIGPDGTVVFTTEPLEPGERPAKLPEINHAEMKLAGKPLETCDKHGGVNCQAGPGPDGQVLCYDGYEGASARFRFTCSSARLEIAEIGKVSDSGAFSVMVRNSKSVTAENPELYLELSDGKKLTLVGPGEIAPFGVGEFVLDLKDLGSVKETPRKQRFQLLCKNCS